LEKDINFQLAPSAQTQAWAQALYEEEDFHGAASLNGPTKVNKLYGRGCSPPTSSMGLRGGV